MIERFAQHKVAANLTMVLMLLAGVWAVKTMPVQLDPPNPPTVISVQVSWPGANAEDIAELITQPIENQLRTLKDLRELTSRSVNGYTSIRAQFHNNANISLALDQVKQRVDNIRNLPANIEPPIVAQVIDMDPIVTLQVTGSGDISELIPLVQRMEKELLQIGVDQVSYNGLPAEEIAIQVSGQALLESGLSFDELAGQISRLSQNVPAGTVGRGQGTRQLRSLDQKRDPLGFEDLKIASGDNLVSLGDMADVVRRPAEGQPEFSRQGRPTIEMNLLRDRHSDAYRAHHSVMNWLDEARQTLPENIDITVGWNAWMLIGAQLDLIFKNGLSGLVLVMLTLFLFLNGRVGLWVAVGIPVTFALGIALIWGLFGMGISIIALFSFIMALGIVVDDAIVVAEDAVTHSENGEPPLQAAIGAARRMFVPVLTSSLTTVAAFLPLLLMGGVLGTVILVLPVVILCVVAASLVECFLVLPGHLKHSLGHIKASTSSSGRAGFRSRFDAAFVSFRRRWFEPLLRRALDNPGATVCATVGFAVISISLVASERVGFAMNVGFSPEELSAQVEFAAAASDEQKADFISHLEDALAATDAENDKPNILDWVLKRNMARFNDETQTGQQYASLTAMYAFKEERSVPPQDFVARWVGKVEQPAYVEQLLIAIDGGINNGMPDIELVLTGDELMALKAGAEELAHALAQYPGVSNVIDNLPYGSDQLVYELTPTGRALGLTPQELGRQLHAAYSGQRVQIFNLNENEYEVKVMLPDEDRDDLLKLEQFPVQTPDGQFVPLANVARFANRRGIDLIRHNGSRMSINISASIDPSQSSARAIIGELEQDVIPGISSRHGLSYGLSGFSQDEQMMLDSFGLGLKLALVMIFLILAWVFSSYLWPLAIMLAIPFGVTGAIVGHWIMGMNLSFMSLLGLLALTGIAVNDSIVLMTFLKHELERGAELKQAIYHAVTSRFRAVLLTSLTTIAGLLPLMFEGSSLAAMIRPLAVTICFGLAFATLLVLLVIPAFILLLEQLKSRLAMLAASNATSRRLDQWRAGLRGALQWSSK